MQRTHWRRGPQMKQRRQRLAKLLRDRREYLGHSAEYVAGEIGVSRWTYADQESGDRSIPSELLPSLARVLCVSVRELAEAVEDRARMPRVSRATGAAA